MVHLCRTHQTYRNNNYSRQSYPVWLQGKRRNRSYVYDQLIKPMALTRSRFEPLVNTLFTIPFQDQEVALELIRADPLREGLAGETSFALLFQWVDSRMLKQGTYTMQHEAMDPVSIFMVPVKHDGTTHRTFNVKMRENVAIFVWK